MALAIATVAGDPITLAELVEAIADGGFDPRDEASLAAQAPLLARLARNRGFLADMAVAELKSRCAAQEARSSYGAQVFVLRDPHGGFGLRANFWPAEDDPLCRASGRAAFFYDHAHDHNFSFLTIGYLGPGYRSDHFVREGAAPAGLPDEPVTLAPQGRSALGEGELLLYRRHLDVHVQLPPERFSVSLNIIAHAPEQAWRDQYRYDIAGMRIAEALTTTPSQALLAAGVALGLGEAIDLAEDFAARHASPRMRMAAIDALAGWHDRRWYERGAADADRRVAGMSRLRLAACGD